MASADATPLRATASTFASVPAPPFSRLRATAPTFVPHVVASLDAPSLVFFAHALPMQGSTQEKAIIFMMEQVYQISWPASAAITDSPLSTQQYDVGTCSMHPAVRDMIADTRLIVPLRIALRHFARRTVINHPLLKSSVPPDFRTVTPPIPPLAKPLFAPFGISAQAVAALFTHQYFPQCHDTLMAMAVWGADSGVRLPWSVLSAPALAKNHASYERNAAAIGLLLREELGTGRIVRLSSRPLGFSSPIAVIPKANGSYRVLSDRSFPHRTERSANAWTQSHCFPKLRLFTVGHWRKLVQQLRLLLGRGQLVGLRESPTCAPLARDSPLVPTPWVAKVDVSKAFRSIPICPALWRSCVFSWVQHGTRVWAYDAAIAMGSTQSCLLYQSVSSACARVVQLAGYLAASYVDDTLCLGHSEAACLGAYLLTRLVLLALQLKCNVRKSPPPSSDPVVVLGVEVDARLGSATLPTAGWVKVAASLRVWLVSKRASLQQWQQLHGQLTWLTQTHRSLCPLLYHFRAALRWRLQRFASTPQIRRRVPPRVLKDLALFAKVAKARPLAPLVHPSPHHAHCVLYTDAAVEGTCGSFGGYCDALKLFISGEFPPEVMQHAPHITALETCTAILMLSICATRMPAGSVLLVWSDATTAVSLINHLSSPSRHLQKCARAAVGVQLATSTHFVSSHIRGVDNTTADQLSRFCIPPSVAHYTQIKPTTRDWLNLVYSSRRH